jgi:hypothetical protein
MTIEIIRHRKLVECVQYSRVFNYRGEEGAGFAFDCDEHGVVDTAKMGDAGRENLRKCLAGERDVVDRGVQKAEWHYYEPAVGRCPCGREVSLDHHFTNTCDCGRDFNGSGQLLAPREQWGEETGETAADILCGSAEDY